MKELKEVETGVVFNNKIIFIDKNDIINENVINIIRREISKSKIGINSEISHHEYNKVQKI